MLWEISVFIVAIAVLILAAFLVPTIIQVRRSAKKLEDVSEKIDQHLPTILANVDEITTNVSAIMTAGRYQVETLGGAVEEVKGIVEDISDFEKQVKKQLQSPLFRSIRTFSAASRAVQVFFSVLAGERLKSRKKKKPRKPASVDAS